MSDSLSVSGPVKVNLEPGSPAAVAYELMLHIGSGDDLQGKDQESRRQYFLTLYRQCYKATSGHGLESILQRD
jgi:hypothetical protein